ncbi:hypothetical protein [Marinibactrum halimedae]|uniref:Uncharacterized protein n=1 Tax=Marinibactrum halimedae TaxID=1444977 RepID=A0AA37T379_9GAMM|nr:hypothetical protein [Marinibactrum halimedae]MCD9458684.1 hypothetical protein [Marinibactrum halimedae]GLS25950.1 hypothetical protein GCM10007877_16650 [Marinibactrum halimedae]
MKSLLSLAIATAMTVGGFSVATLSPNVNAGFSLKDLEKAVDKSDKKCKKGDDSCKSREKLKAAAIVGASAVAIKLIADMVVDYRSKQVSTENDVVAEYKKKHKKLPKTTVASLYDAESVNGDIIEPGTKVVIASTVEVVPGRDDKNVRVQERLTIYDNEDNTKPLKDLTKVVNPKNEAGGRFQNEFTFTFPEGMPQGVYPVGSTLLLNGKDAEKEDNKLQLVLHVDHLGNGQMVAVNQ